MNNPYENTLRWAIADDVEKTMGPFTKGGQFSSAR